ncbi:MAG: histidine phosphatase family protein [Candidatus Pacearchaeota archaeon]|nr:histidine phosphatase family protein [Candidatus Pacearchaeota archaeon]
MKIILVRHGETEENKERIIQGHSATLSELGKEQARKLANRLKDEKIDVIISSDLNRARLTAEEVAKFHPSVKVELREELRERYWGEYQGKRKEDIGNWEEKEFSLDHPESVETFDALSKRVKKLIKYLEKNYSKKTVLLSGHGLINSIIINLLLQEEVQKNNLTHNTSVTIFEFDENGKAELKLFNCTKHLEE